MVRIFVADGREHPDPDASLSIQQVRDLMADFLPDLVGATWTTTERGEDQVIEFTRRVGTKGELFPTGRVVITANCSQTITEAHGEHRLMEGIAIAIYRHTTGDWGQLSVEDKEANNEAVREQLRIFSSYEDIFDERIWVITEWDRSVTTILLPEDY